MKWPDMVKGDVLKDPAGTLRLAKTLHTSWRHYLSDLCALQAARPMAENLRTCNLIGAAISVIAAKEARHVGVTGIVVWTNQRWLHVLEGWHPEKSGHVRLVHVCRKSAVVEISLRNVSTEAKVTLAGPHLCP
jgi:RNase P/RNase MRP subunit p29